MGQVGSSVYKTVTAPFRSQHISNNQRSAVFQDPSTLGITPFVYTRRGYDYTNNFFCTNTAKVMPYYRYVLTSKTFFFHVTLLLDSIDVRSG